MTRILIVEDEPAIAAGLEEDLTFEGYRVDTVADGEAAVLAAREGAFDLLLLDVMLPKKDGFQVCRELRRGGVTTPIILLTARSLEAEKVMGLRIGADDYITKPFGSEELRARIDAVLRRAGRTTAVDRFRFGEYEVDFARCEVARNGVLVDVTAVEFKLLSAFIRSRGRVLSRQQLLDMVWTDTHCVDRVVDSHVANLRKTIEPDPSTPRYLVSVRSLGYRFDG
ncbi:Sensory transduction protein regX3 [Luteitalea pratensis]|uniref:Sensory transduction protein regX3 n=1 Tax=Luteitalea pratensis TaxID=1855912 RepID=A0A143PVT5_LUTPR|nr:response regulator transcription factor [Luteitalea pratensis]AMY12692.1 Sensory transduction protein regX3 [Luteitalea pratensis]